MAVLSHYTSRAGLEGIARTGTLWATNFLGVNDTSELFYAWRQIQRAAFEYALDKMPEDLKDAGADLDTLAETAVEELRSGLTAGSGFGHLFITSFALSKNAEEERRGILTLWDRYTNLEGYCLQYDKADIERMVRLDAMKSSYQWIQLADVRYGLQTETHTFRKLVRQVGEQFLMNFVRQTGEGRIELDYLDHWAPSYLNRQLASYCGTHKDPSFEDEREFRIIAYPHDASVFQFYTGHSSPKEIQFGSTGRKHIVIGDNWQPGIKPRRIVIGPAADRNIDDILEHFEECPDVVVSDIPIRRR